MVLDELVRGKDIDFTKNVIGAHQIAQVEEWLGICLGDELEEYILKYGYLGYEDVELYGINSRQFEKSDMITQTEYLHKYFNKTMNYIGLENIGDGIYILIDAQDNIYNYDSETDDLISLNLKLFEYILKRFTSVG